MRFAVKLTEMPDALYQPFPMLSGRRAQVWRHQPATRRPRHFHAEPELNIVFRGWAKMGVGSHEVMMEPGDVLFLRPAQDHVMLDCSEDLDLFVVAATPELAAHFSLGRWPAKTAVVRLPGDMAEKSLEGLELVQSVASAEPHEYLVGGLFEWALPRSPEGHVIARRALTSLYESDRPVGMVARSLQVNAAELSRRFSRETGVKFVDARSRLRLMRFIESVDSGCSLTRAAAEQFGSYAQCHRVFRRYLECCPRDFFAGKREALVEATFAS